MHNARINNVPKQCVRLLYTYNLNIEENEVGPDSRQVPKIINTKNESSLIKGKHQSARSRIRMFAPPKWRVATMRCIVGARDACVGEIRVNTNRTQSVTALTGKLANHNHKS